MPTCDNCHIEYKFTASEEAMDPRPPYLCRSCRSGARTGGEASYAALRQAADVARSFVSGPQDRAILALAIALDEYEARARAIGITDGRAQEVLREELDKVNASTTLTTQDALDAAARRLVGEAYRGRG